MEVGAISQSGREQREREPGGWLRSQSERVVGFRTRGIAKLEAHLTALREAHAELKANALHLEEASGIGSYSAVTMPGYMPGYMPELGSLGRRAVAKLVGLAPPNSRLRTDALGQRQTICSPK